MSVELPVCTDCGAIVGNAELHAQWHKVFRNMMKIAMATAGVQLTPEDAAFEEVDRA